MRIDPGALLAIPRSLTNVVALSAKGNHGLAVTADGGVVAWGTNFAGESTVPLHLPNVVAIAGGESHSLALLRDGAPSLTVQPWDQSVRNGASPSFVAKAVGLQAMSYQWHHNGTAIAGATGDILSITNAQLSAAGLYTLTVSNQVGMLHSRQAKLSVGNFTIVVPPSISSTSPPKLDHCTARFGRCCTRVHPQWRPQKCPDIDPVNRVLHHRLRRSHRRAKTPR